jgi:H+/Cl- antiporter ClcA
VAGTYGRIYIYIYICIYIYILGIRGAGENIRSLWSVHFQDYSPSSVFIFLAVYFVSAAWTSGLAIPSGNFSPTLLIGSCIGRLYGQLLYTCGLVEKPDAALYALLGAAAFFTGQTRMTVSVCVVMLEMVQSEHILPFLMVCLHCLRKHGEPWRFL